MDLWMMRIFKEGKELLMQSNDNFFYNESREA